MQHTLHRLTQALLRFLMTCIPCHSVGKRENEDSDDSIDSTADNELYRVGCEKIQSLRKLWLPSSKDAELDLDPTSGSYVSTSNRDDSV